MPPSRRKAPKQEAPQTLEQAIALLDEYRDLADATDQLALDAAQAIGQIEGARDAAAGPLKERMTDLFRQLRAWWGVAAPELTDGKRKSIELAGVVIGERTTPPALKLEGITMDALVDRLRDLAADQLIRTTHKLDKPTAIKAITNGDELGELLLSLGARTRQAEEFFIDRPKTEAGTETVPEERQMEAVSD